MTLELVYTQLRQVNRELSDARGNVELLAAQRRALVRLARSKGATLQQVGDVLGIHRSRVLRIGRDA